MSQTRDFVEEIDSHALPEFGGFHTRPFKRSWARGVEVIKNLGGELTHNRIVTFDEINKSVMSGVDLAQYVMLNMNAEWDEYIRENNLMNV